MLIMTNSQVGISCFEKKAVFTSPYSSSSYSSSQWLPCFSVAINKKYANPKVIILSSTTRRSGSIFALSLNGGLGGSGVIDKEVEFKPSFDDYLKAMELAKIGKEKKQGNKLNRYAAKDDLENKDYLKSSSFERDEDRFERKKIRGDLDQELVPNAVKHDGLRDGRSDYKNRKVGKFNHELHSNESSVRSVETRKPVGERTGGRLLKHTHSPIEQSNVYKTPRPGRAITLRSVETRKPVGERRGERLSKYTHSPNEEQSNVYKMPRPGRARVSAVVLNDVGHRMRSSNSLERKAETGSFKEFGSTVNENREKLNRNYNFIKVEEDYKEEISPMDRKRRSYRNFTLEDEDNELSVERAAFRTSENLNEVVNKPRVPLREMEERIQLLAKRLNGADIDCPEWMFSKMVQSAKIKYTDHTILRTIQLLGKLGNWRRVLQVIEWLQVRERYKSYNLRKVYTTALDVLGKARRPVEALNVFHAMQQQMSTYPDLIAYRCVSVTLGQAGHMKELFDVIDAMRSPPKKKFKTGLIEKWDPRLEPDIVVYNAVLNACVQRKNWEGAFWVLQQLKQQGQQPSATTYGLVMEVMVACDKYNLVHEFFRKVQKSFIPTVLAYKVLVNTLWKEGKTDEAVLAVQDMERRGIVGSAALYYDFARCLCSSGRCHEALEQIDKICKVANKPLVVTYTGLMQACLDAGNVQNAVFIFDQMKNFCSPNLVTCNILLKGYLEHGLFEEAKTLLKRMLEDGKRITNKSDYNFRVIPDTFTFNTMLDACLGEKRWDDLEYVYQRMLKNGYHFNAKHHLRIVLEASRAGKEDLLETTWKHFAQMDRSPPPPFTKEMFVVKLAKGDHISAIYCVTSPSESESELHAFSRGSWMKLLKENAQRFRVDSLTGFLDQAAIVTAGSSESNSMLQNLLTACREYLRTNNVPQSV